MRADVRELLVCRVIERHAAASRFDLVACVARMSHDELVLLACAEAADPHPVQLRLLEVA